MMCQMRSCYEHSRFISRRDHTVGTRYSIFLAGVPSAPDVSPSFGGGDSKLATVRQADVVQGRRTDLRNGARCAGPVRAAAWAREDLFARQFRPLDARH